MFNMKKYEGLKVSVDMSTDDSNAGDRLFGTVIEAIKMKSGETCLLVEKTGTNIDSLWHSISEKPDLERPVVFKTYKHNSKYSCTCTYYGSTKEKTKEEVDIRPCDDWAYVDELVAFYNNFMEV